MGHNQLHNVAVRDWRSDYHPRESRAAGRYVVQPLTSLYGAKIRGWLRPAPDSRFPHTPRDRPRFLVCLAVNRRVRPCPSAFRPAGGVPPHPDGLPGQDGVDGVPPHPRGSTASSAPSGAGFPRTRGGRPCGRHRGRADVSAVGERFPRTRGGRPVPPGSIPACAGVPPHPRGST